MFLGGVSVTAHVWMCLLEPSSEQPWVSNYQVVIITTVFLRVFSLIFRTFLGDFTPDGLDSRSLQTHWEWKKRVPLEEYYSQESPKNRQSVKIDH